MEYTHLPLGCLLDLEEAIDESARRGDEPPPVRFYYWMTAVADPVLNHQNRFSRASELIRTSLKNTK